MRLMSKKIVSIALVSGLISFASAQEGHPVKGSWIGEWQGNPAGESVLMVLDWDGEEISGIINPGTDNIEIENAELDPEDWSIRIEADDYVIEGTIARLELPNRSIEGTWSKGNENGNFEIVRQ